MKGLNKIIIKIHNASGSILSLMFVVWFLSGIVLIFDGFPHASRQERFMHLPEFNPRDFENLRAPSVDFKGKVSLEICDGNPVYRVYSGRKSQRTYDARTLLVLNSFDEDFAKRLCTSFNGNPVKAIKQMNSFDQWVPWSYYKPLLPFFKCYMSDPAHTVLYVSQKTGEIVQETNRKERWLARIGAIPHWIYFKQLRLAVGTWRNVIIVISSLGILLALSGIYVGLVRKRKRSAAKGISPYKKYWYKWHHLSGFFFGLFVFTFILSGLISVTSVPDWMVGVNTPEKQKINWDEDLDLKSHQNITPQEIFAAVHPNKGIRKLEWCTVFGQPQFRIYYNNYQHARVYTLKNDSIVPLPAYSIREIKKQADKALGDLPFTIHEQKQYDNYYSASAMFYLPEPAFKIEIDDAANTWLYIDPENGEEVRRLTKNSRARRWTYRFLHTLDLPQLKKVDWLRKSILVLLSIAGLVVSITGLVISAKWFKRTFRKNTKQQLT